MADKQDTMQEATMKKMYVIFSRNMHVGLLQELEKNWTHVRVTTWWSCENISRNKEEHMMSEEKTISMEYEYIIESANYLINELITSMKQGSYFVSLVGWD